MLKSSIHKFFLFCVGFFFLFGCSKRLDTFPETQMSDASFWKNSEDLMIAANRMYDYLPGITNNTNAVWSDDAFGNGPNSISDGSRTVPTTTGSWSDNYALIRVANNILEKSSKITGDEAGVRRFRGEAYFFRAWAYADLVQKYGDVPLILRTFDVKDTLAQAHRTPRARVIESVFEDLDSAIAGLPPADKIPATQYGRVNSGAALALKSRVGLFEGTRNKYHSLGDPAPLLASALDATEKLMESGLYSLFTYVPKPDSSYFYLFQYAGEGRSNKENILVRLYGENQQNSISYHSYTRSQLEQGQVTPTRSFMDAYLYKDGLPLGESPLQLPQDSTMAEFTNRDTRMGMTVFNKHAWSISSFYKPSFSFTPTGYKIRKYFISDDWTINQSYVDNIIIRYGEILLNYAELKYEINGSISDEDLNKSINLLRARGKVTPLTNASVTQHNLNMRDEIRRERRIELAFEGETRYWDLIRWKLAETLLPETVKGTKLFPSEQENSSTITKVDSNGFVIVQEGSQRTFDPNRDYWWPLPTRDLGLDKNLTQNPRW